MFQALIIGALVFVGPTTFNSYEDCKSACTETMDMFADGTCSLGWLAANDCMDQGGPNIEPLCTEEWCERTDWDCVDSCLFDDTWAY